MADFRTLAQRAKGKGGIGFTFPGDPFETQLRNLPPGFGAFPESDIQRILQSPGAQLQRQAQNPLGLTPEQMNALVEFLSQNIGAQVEQATAVTKQATAGAPSTVRQGALASIQNRALGAQQRGLSQIAAGGMDRQMQILLALLDADLKQAQIKAQQKSSLLNSLASLGLGIGGLVAGGPAGAALVTSATKNVNPDDIPFIKDGVIQLPGGFDLPGGF